MPVSHSVASSSAKEVTSLSGTHIVANFVVPGHVSLESSKLFRDFIDERIRAHSLSKVGEVYHEFPGGGFTAVVCLTESHLSVHTWPENRYLTFDVFLSNYLKDNTDITEALYYDVKAFFQARVVFEQFIKR